MSEIDDLRARVEELEGLLIERPAIFAKTKLTPSQRVLAGLLLSRQIVTREMYEVVNYRTECDRPRSESLWAKIAFDLRTKLRPLGIELKNSVGIGYYIEPADKERLRTMA